MERKYQRMKTILLTDGEFTGAIRAIRAIAGDSYRIAGFVFSPSAPHRALLDEPILVSDIKQTYEYDYVRDIIFEYCVDYVFPVVTSGLEAFASFASRLEAETGAMIFISSPDTISIVNHKDRLYDALSSHTMLRTMIPEFRICHTACELKEGIRALHASYEALCVKPTIGENAEGFFQITSSENRSSTSAEDAWHYLTTKSVLHTNDINALPDEQCIGEQILLPYYSGQEWDADVLCKDGHIFAITIRKNISMLGGLTASSETAFDTRIMDAVTEIVKTFSLSYLLSITFRENSHGELFLLEINPRIMGSIFVSTLAGNSLIEKCMHLSTESIPNHTPIITQEGIKTAIYYDFAKIDDSPERQPKTES